MRKHLQISIVVLTAALCQGPALAQPLSIEKVEPPNWWVGMKWHRGQRMFNTIFPKNFYKKRVFEQEIAVRLWFI
jgi:hypothetical protein